MLAFVTPAQPKKAGRPLCGHQKRPSLQEYEPDSHGYAIVARKPAVSRLRTTDVSARDDFRTKSAFAETSATKVIAPREFASTTAAKSRYLRSSQKSAA